MSEEVVEVIWKGKVAKVTVGKLKYGDVEDIIDESISYEGKVPVLKPGKLRTWIIVKGIKNVEIDGKKVKWGYNDVRELEPEEANKIYVAIAKLNNIEEIFRF